MQRMDEVRYSPVTHRKIMQLAYIVSTQSVHMGNLWPLRSLSGGWSWKQFQFSTLNVWPGGVYGLTCEPGLALVSPNTHHHNGEVSWTWKGQRSVASTATVDCIVKMNYFVLCCIPFYHRCSIIDRIQYHNWNHDQPHRTKLLCMPNDINIIIIHINPNTPPSALIVPPHLFLPHFAPPPEQYLWKYRCQAPPYWGFKSQANCDREDYHRHMESNAVLGGGLSERKETGSNRQSEQHPEHMWLFNRSEKTWFSDGCMIKLIEVGTEMQRYHETLTWQTWREDKQGNDDDEKSTTQSAPPRN